MAKSNNHLLKNRAKILSLIKSIPKNKRNEFLNAVSEDTIHAICECLHNLFKNTFGLNTKKCGHLRKKFGPHKKSIKSLINPSTSFKRKRKILNNNQIGEGIFSVLASIVLPAILGAISGK